MLWQVFVIRIEEGDIFAAAHEQALIPHHCQPLISGIVIAYSLILQNERSNNRKGVIPRAIVNDQKLPIAKHLMQNVLNSMSYKTRAIECRQNDREERRAY